MIEKTNRTYTISRLSAGKPKEGQNWQNSVLGHFDDYKQAEAEARKAIKDEKRRVIFLQKWEGDELSREYTLRPEADEWTRHERRRTWAKAVEKAKAEGIAKPSNEQIRERAKAIEQQERAEAKRLEKLQKAEALKISRAQGIDYETARLLTESHDLEYYEQEDADQ